MFTYQFAKYGYALLLGVWFLLVIPAGASFLLPIQQLRADQDRLDGLKDGGEAVFSPDGQYLYVAASAGYLSVYHWDQAGSRWAFVEQKQDGVAGLDGLGGVEAIAMTPTGDMIYVASTSDAAITSFRRDAATGKLTYLEMKQQGVGGVDGLSYAIAVAVSPDGRHVYAAGLTSGTIAIFSRNLTTGRLTYLGNQQDGVAGVDGLNLVSGVTVSPDGAYVYATGLGDQAIVTFQRNPTSGLLTFKAVHKEGVGGVTGLAGYMTPVVSPDGQYVYVAMSSNINNAPSALTVFKRNTTTGALTFVEANKEDQPGLAGLTGLDWVAVSADSQTVYSGAGAAVTRFHRDGTTGHLTQLQVFQDGQNGVDGLAITTWVGVTPDGQRLFALGRDDEALTAFSRDGLTGALTFSGVQHDGDGGQPALVGASQLTLSPSGDYLYAAGSASLAVFNRDPATGRLTFGQMITETQNGVVGPVMPRQIAVSPDGENIYVAINNGLIAFYHDPAGGQLTFVGAYLDGQNGLNDLDNPYSLALSPDGQYLYLPSNSESALTVFRREGAQGALSLAKVYREGENGVTGLYRPAGITISPDGQYLYATELLSSTVAIFQRDPVTGELAAAGQLTDAANLDWPYTLLVSPNGQQLYLTGLTPGSLAVFNRNQATGQLSLVEVHHDNQAGVDGLANAIGLAVSPDGRRLYVAGLTDNAVAVFDRDPLTGKLTFIEVEVDGQGGLTSLASALAVTVSADSRFVYATGPGDDALVTFITPLVNYLPVVTRK